MEKIESINDLAGILKFKESLNLTSAKYFLAEFFKKCDDKITDEEIESLLYSNEYKSKKIISFKDGYTTNYEELISHFNKEVNIIVSEIINSINDGIIIHFLKLPDNELKKSFCSSIYLLLSHLYLDMEKVIRINNAADFRWFSDKLSGYEFFKMYYGRHKSGLRSFIYLFKKRYEIYIESNILDFVEHLKSVPMTGSGIATLNLYNQTIDNINPVVEQESSKLEWLGTKTEILELTALLVNAEVVSLKKNGRKVGNSKLAEHLSIALGAVDMVKHERYYGDLQDIKGRDDEFAFLNKLKNSFLKYIQVTDEKKNARK